MKKPLLLLLAPLALGLLAGVVYFQRPDAVAPPLELQQSILPEPRPLAPFRLTAHDGTPLSEADLQGRWSVVFFGYTHCPDVCPTVLQTLAGVAARLPPENLAATRFLFVSVDPKRDSLDYLKSYLAYFHPAFLGATGERQQIDAVVRQFGALYSFEGDTSRDDYVVNHSATLFVVDPEGRLYARIHPPHEAARVADTLIRLRDFYNR